MSNQLKPWVDAVVRDRYENVAGRLAEAIDLSESAFSRGVARGTLGIDSLLRLAAETGEPASQLLRMAGKPDIAAAIEKVYGPERPTLPRAVQDVVEFLLDESIDASAVQKQFVVTARWWKDFARKREPTVAPTFSSRPGVKSRRATRGTR